MMQQPKAHLRVRERTAATCTVAANLPRCNQHAAFATAASGVPFEENVEVHDFTKDGTGLYIESSVGSDTTR